MSLWILTITQPIIIMKKQSRGVKDRGETMQEKAERSARVKSKEFIYNSPNKQNDLGSANLRNHHSPLPPLTSSIPLASYQSPSRNTPLETLDILRSNKSKEALQEQPQGRPSSVLFCGLSKDGKYRMQSHSLEGESLARAVEHEKQVALSSIISAGREKDRGKTPQIQTAKISSKENGVVRAYAINTHAGTTRGYNEDRVSITLNIKKNGTRSQFFAVYDGHGGSNCCDFLKDHLHEHVISHKDFPNDPKRALYDAVMACEERFLEMAKCKDKGREGLDRSGSCALIVLLVEDACYVANVGDSRAVLSTEGGKLAFNLSRDHRPIDIKEQQRVLNEGGKIYRTEMTKIPSKKQQKAETIIGPLRIYPGKLSVSRTIGDIQAKQQFLGGTKGVISAEPEIKKFRLTGREDFILLCCDGVFERMESMEVIEIAWQTIRKQNREAKEGKETNQHQLAGKAVDAILKEAMLRKSADNLTAIMICLSDLKQRSKKTLLHSP